MITRIIRKTSLERLVVNNYSSFLSQLEKEQRSNRNGKTEKLMHLEWLLKKEKNRPTKVICPQCKEEPVRYFYAVFSFEKRHFSFDPKLTACEKKECADKINLPNGTVGDLLPICFSSVEKFESRKDKKRVVNLLKKLFGLQPPVTDNFLFDFFSN